MKLKNQYSLKARAGETRVVTKFLLWPRKFLNSPRTRWLERSEIREEIMAVDVGGSCEWGNYAWKWRETGFADEETT
jgi:hypothetical protein